MIVNCKDMNTIIRKEIEEFIVSGREKTEAEFKRMVDVYLQDKTEKDKNEMGEALADFCADRIRQLVEIDKELAMLRQSDTIEEMAEIEC